MGIAKLLTGGMRAGRAPDGPSSRQEACEQGVDHPRGIRGPGINPSPSHGPLKKQTGVIGRCIVANASSSLVLQLWFTTCPSFLPSLSLSALTMARAVVLLLSVMVLAMASMGSTHSLLRRPPSNVKLACRSRGFKYVCNGKGNTACPPNKELRHPRVGSDPSVPGATWQRGSQQTIHWARNNHYPVGFVRLALVPVAEARSVAAHAKYAFWWSCFGALMHKCERNEKCDRAGLEYGTKVTIPTVLPDGNYVLGMSTLRGQEGLSLCLR